MSRPVGTRSRLLTVEKGSLWGAPGYGIWTAGGRSGGPSMNDSATTSGGGMGAEDGAGGEIGERGPHGPAALRGC